MAKNQKQIGANIRRLRKQAGLTQEGLSERARMNSVYLSRLECGLRGISTRGLLKIAIVLGVSFSEITRGVLEGDNAVKHISDL